MEPCPAPDELDGFGCGALPEDRRAFLEEHLSLCAVCCEATARAMRFDEALASRSHRRLGEWRWAAAAAAGLLLAFGIGFVLRHAGERPPARPSLQAIPGTARFVVSLDEVLDRPELVELSDGTRVRVGERTTARLVAPASGERHRLSLERGSLEVQVPKGAGRLSLATPAGEVRVLGTRFRARAIRLGGENVPESLRLGDAACVEVSEGLVALRNAQGEIQLPAGIRGVSFAGSPPLKQEAGGTWEQAVEQFARVIAWDGGAPRIPAERRASATLLATAWWGFHGAPPADWAERSGPEGSAGRKAAALLSAMGKAFEAEGGGQ